MKKVIGQKDNKDLYAGLIGLHIPKDIKIYVEPFGGSFVLNKFFDKKPELMVYNDIIEYPFEVKADRIHHLDYKEVIQMYDSPETFFFLDPPYYAKEQFYGLPNKFNSFHEELREFVTSIKGNFAMSYERCRYIEKLYVGFNIYSYEGPNPFLTKEIIITR